MTTPDPNDSATPEPQTILKSLIDAFKGLPALLSYGGLILIVAFLFLYFTGVLPDILLAVPVIAIVAFLLYAFMERHYDLQSKRAEQGYELEKQKQELDHARVMAQTTASKPEPPSQTETNTHKQEAATAKEWQCRYLDHLMGICSYPPSMALVDIKEAGLGGQKLALSRIFTSLDVPAPQQEKELSRKSLDLDDMAQLERVERERSLKAISRDENKKLVILGAPGSGKSTLVNYLTLCLAGDHLAGKRRTDISVTEEHLRQDGWELSPLHLLPVRVILREYAARGLSQGQDIWQFIAADLSRDTVGLGGYVDHLQQHLQEEGGILLLDGLDEVDKAGHVRDALKANIEKFARDFHKVRVIVTSRPYAYGSGWELQGFKVTRLLSFSDEQIKFFIEQWYTVMGQQDPTLGPEKAADFSQSLVKQIERTADLREMARHPLLLTMMVYIHRGREGGALPHRREELYRLSVILLLDLWRRSKTIPGKETETLAETLGMDTEQMQTALAEVAYVAHREQPAQTQTADIPGELVAGKLYKYKSKESDADLGDVIEYVRDRAGLLEDHGRNAADTDDVYRFPHRTFQEYLAAMYLLHAPDFPEELVALARQDPGRWREVVLLAGAGAMSVMRWGLVEALYGAKLPPPAADAGCEEDWWGAFLAGQVLAENNMLTAPPATHQEKCERVRLWHKAIVQRGVLPAKDRALAGQVLAQLGDDRPGVGVVVQEGLRLPDIVWGGEVPAGAYEIGGDKSAYQSFDKQTVTIPHAFQLASCPITNSQFQCFVEAPDVENGAWWQGIPDDEKRFREPQFPYANYPRETVSWYQAVAFCRWLSAKRGETILLPHEYEWEAAARWAGKKTDNRAYPWGMQFDTENANTDEGGVGQTTAVALYPAGRQPELGLHDMSGNVWEWCRNKYNYPDDEHLDSDVRVVRGGSWASGQYHARAADRLSSTPDYRFNGIGFRDVVRRPPSHVL